ncbi:MAG TPA: DedA family protein [Mycobacteriales bacterium]|jgi:membrane protein DedA with SNARE-associated domain|nr:DedA family protein [Mycobacteriales bacterium]
MLPEWLAAAGTKPLPGVFHHFEGLLRDWGYAAVGGVLFGENIGLPLPGETILVAAALYAGTGRLNIWLVAIIAFITSVGGACVGYVVGDKGGRPLLERYGKFVFVTPDRLDRLERFFQRRGALIVVVGRFIEGARQLMGIVAGVSEMTFKRFLVFTTLGAALWTAFWAGLGYFAGDHVEAISHYATYVAIAVGVLFVGWLGWRIWHRRHIKRTA